MQLRYPSHLDMHATLLGTNPPAESVQQHARLCQMRECTAATDLPDFIEETDYTLTIRTAVKTLPHIGETS